MRVCAIVAAIPASLLFTLTGCGGGGPSRVSTPPVIPLPTITVHAPEAATAGVAFSVEWTASDATSCSAPFTADTGTSGSALVIATVIGDVEYSVTCTGDGRSSTASATVSVSAPNAEGLWQGTTEAGRNLSGVVTKEGEYWLAYSVSGDDSLVGFYSGSSVQTMTVPPAGTLTSGNLREVNFVTGFSGGSTAAGAISAGNYSAKSSISGTLAPVSGGTVSGATFSVVASGVTAFSTSSGNGTGTLNSNGELSIHFDSQTTTVPGLGASTISDINDAFLGSISGDTYTIASGAETMTGPCAGNATICGTADDGFGTPVTLTITDGNASISGSSAISFEYTSSGVLSTVNYTLTNTGITLSSLPSIDADAFTLDTYNPAYEATPLLAALADTYDGIAGVGAAQPDGEFVVGSDGAISGSDVGGCDYSGTAVIHPAGGNFYDITLTLSGVSCTAAGDFTGVATYDANGDNITVMALSADREQGFMFVGAGVTP